MATPGVQQITDFEHRFAKAQATEVVELPWGYALLQKDFPLSHDHNRVVVTSPASAEDVIRTTDEVLGTAGLEHRYASVNDDAQGQALAGDFVAAGFDHETITVMIYEGPEPKAATHDVRAVSVEALRPALIRDWAVDLPNASAEVFDQLADRTKLYSRGAEVTLLVVHEGEEIAARSVLYIDRDARIAQFENLFTHPDFRGRGYANSLICEALARGKQAGCDVSFLTADTNDWPYGWYLRQGYVDAHRSHHFTRVS